MHVQLTPKHEYLSQTRKQLCHCQIWHNLSLTEQLFQIFQLVQVPKKQNEMQCASLLWSNMKLKNMYILPEKKTSFKITHFKNYCENDGENVHGFIHQKISNPCLICIPFLFAFQSSSGHSPL
jgi:hypothetical protein